MKWIIQTPLHQVSLLLVLVLLHNCSNFLPWHSSHHNHHSKITYHHQTIHQSGGGHWAEYFANATCHRMKKHYIITVGQLTWWNSFSVLESNLPATCLTILFLAPSSLTRTFVIEFLVVKAKELKMDRKPINLHDYAESCQVMMSLLSLFCLQNFS